MVVDAGQHGGQVDRQIRLAGLLHLLHYVEHLFGKNRKKLYILNYCYEKSFYIDLFSKYSTS
jgi:hypothetical protein